MRICLSILLFCSTSLFAQPASFVSRGIGGGGALFYPSISPHNPQECYLACDMSEIFHTTNSGLSWMIPDFSELRSSGMARIRFSGDPQVLYAIQGGDVLGLSKSTNGGVSWSALAADPTGGEAYGLFVDPTSGARLIASDYTTLYFSSDGGATFSTGYTSGGGLHLAGAVWAGDSIYVGSSAGLLVSTNGGNSFSVLNAAGIPAGRSFLSLCGARSGNAIRLFAIVADNADIYPGIGGGDYGIFQGLYTWDVGQPAWVQRTTGIAANDRMFYLDCSPTNINVAYAAGSSLTTYHPTVLKTTDGGASWQSIFLTVNNQNIATSWCGDHGDVNWGWAECPLGFTVCGGDPNRVLVTDYGFAHLTVDGGVTWRQVYSDSADSNPAGAWTPRYRAYHGVGLEPTAVWNVMWADSLTMIGSYTDIRGTRSTDGGLSWARLKLDTLGTYSVNTTYHVVKHPQTGVLYAATSSVHDLYQSTYLADGNIDGGRGQIWTSANNGATWSLLHDFAHPVIWLALDPTNSSRLYASVVHSTLGGIFVTNNLQNGPGSTWTLLTTPPRTQGHPFNVAVLNDGTVVCTYSGRRGGSPQQFTQSSGVFVSTNGGASWSDRSDPMMLYWTKDLVIDPHDASQSTWYVSVRRGWGGPPNALGGLFRTTNRGVSWTRIWDELYAEGCGVDPLDSNKLYATSSGNGLWFTSNLRAANPSFSRLTEYPFSHPNRVAFDPYRPGEVWFCSFGNGLRWGSTLSAPNSVSDLTVHAEGGQVMLRWTGAEGAISYNVYRATMPDFSAATLLTQTSNLFVADSVTGQRSFYWVTSAN